MLNTILASSSVILVGVLLLWFASLLCRNASIIDAFWGAGFVLVVGTSWLLHPLHPSRHYWLAGMILLWGIRLSVYLFWRNVGQAEDYRYAAMRKKHGERFWLVSLGTVFLLQGLILIIVSLPVQVALATGNATPMGWIDVAGMLIWMIGMLFEGVGDWQLARFKSDPANDGRVMDRGLWRLTRHPNYFGDFCVWWGVYLVAAAGGAGWTVISPLLMSYLLIRVSGVTLLEKTISDRRPAYAAYMARTNAFFPGWPRSESGGKKSSDS